MRTRTAKVVTQHKIRLVVAVGLKRTLEPARSAGTRAPDHQQAPTEPNEQYARSPAPKPTNLIGIHSRRSAANSRRLPNFICSKSHEHTRRETHDIRQFWLFATAKAACLGYVLPLGECRRACYPVRPARARGSAS